LGTYVMRAYANIETVFVASLLAGSLLGRWWTVLVPLSALAVLQPLEWGMTYRGYMVGAMAGITFFVVSGYVFVGVLGRRLRPRVLFRVKSVALLTTISVPLTIAYDLWTATGERASLTRPLAGPGAPPAPAAWHAAGRLLARPSFPSPSCPRPSLAPSASGPRWPPVPSTRSGPRAPPSSPPSERRVLPPPPVSSSSSSTRPAPPRG